MNFASDNWAGVHPAINAALSKVGQGYSAAGGNGALDLKVMQTFNALFEREVAVFYLPTGTAANALAFANYNQIGAVGFCHREAHIREDECGGPEYFTDGGRLRIVDGANGKMDPQNLTNAIESTIDAGVPGGKAAFVSITQATEAGTVHTTDELMALSKVAQNYNLPLHMDGSRFANALAALKCTPAEMTWKSGIDVVSFGATKNGCWCAEALIFMNPEDAELMPYLMKRSGHTVSKTRFISAQLAAYFEDDLWLELAGRANAAGKTLAERIRESKSARLAWQSDINEVFAIVKKEKASQLKTDGAHFYDWPAPFGLEEPVAEDEIIIRLVTSFSTSDEEINAFSKLL